MHVFISHPELLPDLCTHIERSGWVVDGCYGREAKVHLLDAVSSAQARRELDIYLAVWQAMHPGVEAYVLRPKPRPVSDSHRRGAAAQPVTDVQEALDEVRK